MNSLSAEEYFASPGVSNTMLGLLAQSPAHLQHYLSGDVETTKAMEIGTFFHDLILLNNAPRNIAIKPEGMKFNTREGKAWRTGQEAEGKRILTQDEHDSIFGMRDAVMGHPKLKYAVESGFPEQSLFAPFGTVTRKCRIDLVPKGPALLDFKSTDDASPVAFGRKAANMGYYRQAAYYLDIAKENGLPHTSFVLVAVEKSPPYAVGIYYLTPDQIELGRKRYTDLLQRYIECRDANCWPGYSTEPQPLELPKWLEAA